MFPPGWIVSACRPDRGDYRLRRAWPGWRIDRRWLGGWTRIGWFLTWAQAHSVFHELDDWQVTAGPDTAAVMRGERTGPWLGRPASPGERPADAVARIDDVGRQAASVRAEHPDELGDRAQ